MWEWNDSFLMKFLDELNAYELMQSRSNFDAVNGK